MITLSDIMKQPLLKDALLVAGKNGVDREIQSVNIMDAPDIADWVKKHELLLTTAYVIKDDQLAQIRLVERLAKKGCSGLGIKTKRFLTEIPPAVKAAADLYDFPIFELPLKHSLGEIMNQVMAYIIRVHYQYKERSKFVLDWLEGRISTREEILQRGRRFGIMEGPHLCVVGKPRQKFSYSPNLNRFVIIAEKIFSIPFPGTIAARKADTVIFILPIPQALSSANSVWESKLEHCTHLLNRQCNNESGTVFHFGISSICSSLGSMARAYQHATEALFAGVPDSSSQYVLKYYEPQKVADLLQFIPIRPLMDFHSKAVGRLTQLKEGEQEELLTTLSAYLQNNCRVSETAKKIYVHRNTVLYRIEKCKEILQCDLEDPEENLRLRLALYIHDFLKNSHSTTL